MAGLTITVAELREALSGSLTLPDEGFTTAEVAEHLGVCETTARKHVRTLVKQGALRSSRKRISDMSGRVRPVPSYVIVEG